MEPVRRDLDARRSMRRERRRRQVRRRRRTLLVCVVGSLGALISPVRAVALGASAHPRAADPGALPQTGARPSAHTAAFHREMADLFRGVVHDSVADALPAFFPERAYAQVKAIADPGADWSTRLVGDLRLDLGAARRLLGSGAVQATLEEVLVPAAYAHWVPPGACDNRVGYWEVPNARVVYREHGRTRSFGIASMISWRGVWYVVHLGAVLRAGSAGEVDDPSAGIGTSAPSSTC